MTQSTLLSILSLKTTSKVMVKCIPDSTKHSSPRISLLVVNYITIQNVLQICWILSELLRWNFAILKTNKKPYTV